MAALLAAAACARLHPAAPLLRVGTSGDYPPFTRAHDGAFDGLDVEIARRFTRDTGRRLELVVFRWSDLVRDLDAGRFDLAMGGVTMRPERAVAATFTRPVTRAGAVVLAPPGTSATRPGLRLAVNAGGHLERLARRLFPQATLVPTDNRTLPDLVAAGAADALLTDEVEVMELGGRLPGAVAHGPFTRDAKAYLGRDPVLVAELDAWLRAREADGTLARLRGRWLGPRHANPRTPVEADLDALLALVDLRLSFMPAIAAAKQRAGRPVEDPAQEARVLEVARAQAVEHGLVPGDVEALFRALLDAARAVQRRFLAAPWATETLDLEREARPAVARVSEQIVARAADVARNPGAPAPLEVARVADLLDPSLAPAPERAAIARAIVGLRRVAGREGGRASRERMRVAAFYRQVRELPRASNEHTGLVGPGNLASPH